MDKQFVNKMKKKLLQQKEEIISNLIKDNESFQEIVEDLDPKDFADIAADDIDKKTLEALGSAEIKRLRLIDSAMARIENGKYGYCMSCGKKIPKERLEAIPYALMCVACKSSEERRNR
ncbi:MAG: TraR/DksA family transcriptional regulator [Spirochaetales bacterium]|nr:TraR/DksA family transcriptional regulator [Spirochaetales bacterium]MCF7938142.1 TraR/DksA family transcriptional regulator [Spirochaetales bacterium]